MRFCKMCDSELEEGRDKVFCGTSCRVQYQMLLIEVEGVHAVHKEVFTSSLQDSLNKALNKNEVKDDDHS